MSVRYEQPGATIEVTADGFATGLAGTIGVRLLDNAVAISAGRSGRTRCPHAVPEGGIGAEERRFVGTTTLKPASAVGRVLAGQAPTARGREPAIEPIPCRCAGICSHPLHHPAEQAGLPLHPSAPRP